MVINGKEDIYNSTKNLVGMEHSTITRKNNKIKGEGTKMGVVVNDEVANELIKQAQQIETDSKTKAPEESIVEGVKSMEENKDKPNYGTKENPMTERDAMNQVMVSKDEPHKINGHVLVIGVGQGGGKATHLATHAQFTTMAVNTAPEDMTNIDVDYTFIVRNAHGSGKEPRRAKQKFIEDSDRFLEEFEPILGDKKTVIVVHTSNGGTGAGIGPMVSKFIKDNYPDVNVFVFTLLGDIKEDVHTQENAVGVIEELDKTNVNYVVFDNGKSSGASVDELYDKVNKDALAAMRFIAKEYFIPTERQNIDLIDTQKLYMDNTRMVIVSGKFNRRVSGSCDYEQQIVDAINASVQIGPCGSAVSAYGILINVEESMYSELDENFRKFQEIVGEPYEFFKQLQTRQDKEGPDFTICITGLDPIADRYKLINQRISEFNDRRAANKTIAESDKVTIVGRGANKSITVPGESGTERDKKVNKSSFSDFI